MVDGNIDSGWLENPLVARAIRVADGDPLGTLEALHGMLTELEDAVPGVPFRTILQAANPTDRSPVEARAKVAGMLLDRGLGWEEVDQTLGTDARRHLALSMRVDGYKIAECVARCHVPKGYVVANGANGKAKALIEAIDAGATIPEAAARVGVSESTARRYLHGKLPRTTGAAGFGWGDDLKWKQVARYYHSHTIKETMEHFDCTKQYVMESARKGRKAGLVLA